MAKKKEKEFSIAVRWHARAEVKVFAKNINEAISKVTLAGIPWEIGEEADDGDGYEVGLSDKP